MKHIFFFSLFTFFINPILIAQDKQEIEVNYIKEEDGQIHFMVKNNGLLPYQISINFKELINYQADKQIPFFTVVYPNDTAQKIISLKPIKAGSTQSFKFDYAYLSGDPTLNINENYPYIFPYPHGKKYKLSQGYEGTLTHKNINALDFSMPQGDTVLAAREGLVVESIDHHDKGGRDPILEPYANKIVILHDDGTMGHYVHLMKDGSLVKVGDKIQKGQVIGLSGNTGFSFGPHLHFMVVKPEKMKHKTIKTKFIDTDGGLIAAEEGKYYYSFHPGKPDFEIKTADRIDLYELKNQKMPSSISNNIRIVTEKIDDLVLIYVENGFNRSISGKVSAKITNLKPSSKLPYLFQSPPNSKILLFSLQPIAHNEATSYQLSIEYKK